MDAGSKSSFSLATDSFCRVFLPFSACSRGIGRTDGKGSRCCLVMAGNGIGTSEGKGKASAKRIWAKLWRRKNAWLAGLRSFSPVRVAGDWRIAGSQLANASFDWI